MPDPHISHGPQRRDASLLLSIQLHQPLLVLSLPPPSPKNQKQWRGGGRATQPPDTLLSSPALVTVHPEPQNKICSCILGTSTMRFPPGRSPLHPTYPSQAPSHPRDLPCPPRPPPPIVKETQAPGNPTPEHLYSKIIYSRLLSPQTAEQAAESPQPLPEVGPLTSILIQLKCPHAQCTPGPTTPRVTSQLLG